MTARIMHRKMFKGNIFGCNCPSQRNIIFQCFYTPGLLMQTLFTFSHKKALQLTVEKMLEELAASSIALQERHKKHKIMLVPLILHPQKSANRLDADRHGFSHQVNLLVCNESHQNLLNSLHSINGCSLKTSENLIAALSIPPEW